VDSIWENTRNKIFSKEDSKNPTMLYHLVLLRLTSNISKQQEAELYTALDALRDIPGVVYLQCGKCDKNVYDGYQERSHGYTHSLVTVLEDAAALEVYDKNTYHIYVKQQIISPLLDNDPTNPVKPICAVDYEGQLEEFPWKRGPEPSLFSYGMKALVIGGLVLLLGVGGMRLRSRL
jgi:hypothetical protein